MGKGDRRTRRGKIFRGTFGKSRPRKKKKNKSIERKTKPVQSTQVESEATTE